MLLKNYPFGKFSRPNSKNAPLKLSNNEFESLADQLADEFIAYVGQNVPPLTDYAVSREGIYED